MEFYRSSAVGNALIQSLNEMLANQELSNEEAVEILKNFDEKFSAVLRENILVDKHALTNEMKGVLANYNNFIDLWKIDAEQIELQIGPPEAPSVTYDRARILFSNPAPTSTIPPAMSPTDGEQQKKP